MASPMVTVADVDGRKQLSVDRSHRLVVRAAAGEDFVVENRPVTEFAAAVDPDGRLHVAALLLSRQLMYYTSRDGRTFTRSALLKGDSMLRLRDLQLWAGRDIHVAYVAETEHADTLVCYRSAGEGWDGSRLAEVLRPQRLTALQFDGAPGSIEVLYSVKDNARCEVFAISAEGGTAESVLTLPGGFGDFCAITVGGVRHACWLADGYLSIDGTMQPSEPWAASYPTLRREGGGMLCSWLEDGQLHGVVIGDRRSVCRPQALPDAVTCRLAAPGELRRAILNTALRETVLQREPAGNEQPGRAVRQPFGLYREREKELTLAEVVHNQAVFLTRMQESLSGVERSVLRQQAELNRLEKEVSALLRSNERETGQKAVAQPPPRRSQDDAVESDDPQ